MEDTGENVTLHGAVESGNLEAAQLLISRGANVEEINKERRTVLHVASLKGFLPIVLVLLQANAKVDAEDIYSYTPVQLAVLNSHKDIVFLLLSSGATLQLHSLLDKMSYAGKCLAVRCLIAMGADISKTDFPRILCSALMKNNFEMAHILLAGSTAGNDAINACGLSGFTPLQFACSELCNIGISKQLFQHRASINAPNDVNIMPLLAARELSTCELLLQHGADPHIVDFWGCTPLHQADTVQFVDLLTQYNVLVDARDKNGRTALHYASKKGKTAVVNRLIQLGASVNTKDKYDLTPLYLSISSSRFQSTNLLLEKGADYLYTTKCGKTMLHVAAGSRINFISAAAIARLLLHMNVPVNVRDQKGNTSLHLAARLNNHRFVHVLIRNNAHVNAVNKNGQTALDIAMDNYCWEVIEVLKRNGGNSLL